MLPSAVRLLLLQFPLNLPVQPLFFTDKSYGKCLPSPSSTVLAKVHHKKSLKQRVDDFGKELFDWVQKKDQENPGPSIVAGDQVQNAYQMGAQNVYLMAARAEYERRFAPRGVTLQEELKRCGIDITKNPYYTNPGFMGNTRVDRHLSLSVPTYSYTERGR